MRGAGSMRCFLLVTFPRWLIESGLGEEAVKDLLGGDTPASGADHDTWRLYWDQPVSIDQIRAIAARSRRPFWLYGEMIYMDQVADLGPPTRTLTAAEALELVGPVGLDEVHEKGGFGINWRERGWGPRR